MNPSDWRWRIGAIHVCDPPRRLNPRTQTMSRSKPAPVVFLLPYALTWEFAPSRDATLKNAELQATVTLSEEKSRNSLLSPSRAAVSSVRD